jgi:hypothetical protein
MLTEWITEINELHWMCREEDVVEFKVISLYLSEGNGEKHKSTTELFLVAFVLFFLLAK